MNVLQQIDPLSLALGLMTGLLIAFAAAGWAWRRGVRAEAQRSGLELQQLQSILAEREQDLAEATTQQAVTRTRLEEQQAHFDREKAGLQEQEKRLAQSFENLSAKIFDARSKSFTELSEKQLGGLLKPLTTDLKSFKEAVEETNKENIARHSAMTEKLRQLETLNQTLHKEAQNLTRALTHDVKAQGNWGEQQLERLLELAGLKQGQDFYTQVSVKGKDGQRLQPDFVLQLPGATSIVLDSKVSLTAWTEFQSAPDDEARAQCLARHVQSLRAHIDGLHGKNYPQAEELNSLPFVLMFVPIESALIAALQADAGLAEYALKRSVSLLSPANFLSTARTVASVWQLHKQETNAKEIARRGGLLVDKFVGFVDNLKGVGSRLDQAQSQYRKAIRQLSEGPGNLVSQARQLSELGARHEKQLDQRLLERAVDTDSEEAHLKLIEAESEAGDNDEDTRAGSAD